MPTCLVNDAAASHCEFLEQYDAYIQLLARKQIPPQLVPPEILDLEIDELVQRVRIKLWLVLQKRSITHPKAYIRFVVHTTVIDMVRQYRLTLPLPLDENCEIYQGNLLIRTSKGMYDPAVELEQEEIGGDSMEQALDAVALLPPRQRHAMICLLKDQLDSILPLVDIFRNQGVDVETIAWPDDRTELQRLRASVSPARKKLRHLLDSSSSHV